ncbi:hypothetical protein L195_g053281, partial [Trifolium pratense]
MGEFSSHSEAMSRNGLPNNLPTLEGKNWERWSKQMKSLFGFQDTLEVVTNGVQELQANATAEQRNSHGDLKKKDSKAMYAIQAACYEGGEKVKTVKLQALRRQYEVLEMDKNESIAEYVSKVQGLVHTMKNCGEIITDRMIIEK